MTQLGEAFPQNAPSVATRQGGAGMTAGKYLQLFIKLHLLTVVFVDHTVDV